MLGDHGRHGAAVVVDGLLAAKDGVEGLSLRVGRQLCRNLHGVLRSGIDANGFVSADGERLAQDGVAVGSTDGGDDHLASSGFHQLEGPHQGVPFVIGVDDELHPFLIEAGVALGERNARRGVRGLADADEKIHALNVEGGGRRGPV